MGLLGKSKASKAKDREEKEKAAWKAKREAEEAAQSQTQAAAAAPRKTQREKEADLFRSHAASGNLAGLRYLVLERNVDVNPPDERGWTPLFAASHNGKVGAVRFLVAEAFAEPNATTTGCVGDYPAGLTPLDAATWEGHAGARFPLSSLPSSSSFVNFL